MKRVLYSFGAVLLTVLSAFEAQPKSVANAPEGWQTAAPREELRPLFAYKAKAGADGKGAFIIQSDAREGLHGYWTKPFPVKGGGYYAFHVLRRIQNVESPRRSVVARLLWQDEKGRSVLTEEPVVKDVLQGMSPVAEPEYPAEGKADRHGWTEMAGLYRAPAKAARAVVELHLQWAPEGRVEWSAVSLDETNAPQPRKVRLASVHYRPSGGKTTMDNCRQFEPLIEDAANQKADLVVLPETLTYFGLGKSYADCAEPVPGPATEYFAGLAKRHNLYIVAGLL